MLVNWIRDNPIIYDKGLSVYWKKLNKREMWAKKAAEVGLTVDQLTTWYESNRTRYGKLIKTKSGQGQQRITQRGEWVLKSFDFLKSHIYRQPSRSACSVSKFYFTLIPYITNVCQKCILALEKRFSQGSIPANALYIIYKL